MHGLSTTADAGITASPGPSPTPLDMIRRGAGRSALVTVFGAAGLSGNHQPISGVSPELGTDDPLLERVPAVEQQPQGPVPGLRHLDCLDRTKLALVSGGGHRSQRWFDNVDADCCEVRQEGAGPVQRPQRADRRQREQFPVQGNDGPASGPIVRSRSSRCRDEHSVSYQLWHPDLAVHRDSQAR
jgi:hypothetical protein